MRVFNAIERGKLLARVTALYLSDAPEDNVIYDHPEPADCGLGAWYPVRLFVRYDNAGIDTAETIAWDFYTQWRDHVHQDLSMSGGDVVDSVANFIRAMDGASDRVGD